MYKSLVGFPRSLEAIRVPFSAPVFGPRQRIPRPSFQGPRLFLAPHFFNRAGTVCPPTLSRETSPDTPAPRDPPETATRDTSPTALRETTSPIPPRRHPSARRPPRHPLPDTPRRERFHAEPATRSPSRGDAWGPPPAATRV
jgi:hypothetical protein